jgi:hypothetical protein
VNNDAVLDGLDDRADALARGTHREVVAELSARVVARPLDERLVGQLMVIAELRTPLCTKVL